jgi:prefoldin subunit 5
MPENSQEIKDVHQMARALSQRLDRLTKEMRLIQQGIESLTTIGEKTSKKKSGPVEIQINGKKHKI